MPALFVLVLIPLLFYIIFPLGGAFHVRSIWRRFRETMINASFFPICTYEDIIFRKSEGYFRFFGEIEAIQSEGLLWVRNSEMSMTVRMRYCNVYMIPPEAKMNTQIPARLHWNSVMSLPEGTDVYICGDVKEEEGRAVFSGSRKEPLTVIFYDGEKGSLLERSISWGRQKNEYWNFMTPWSIAIGGILSLVLLNMMIRARVSTDVLMGGIIVASLPVIPFIPPGLIFFYFYNSFWKKGRLCRSDRDLLTLPLRFEERNISVPSYRHQRFSSDKPLYPLREGYSVRSVSLPLKKKGSLWDCSAFGAVVSRRDGLWLDKPDDPMKEYIVIYGDPGQLAAVSSERALGYEFLAMFSIALSLAVNILFMIRIIHLI